MPDADFPACQEQSMPAKINHRLACDHAWGSGLWPNVAVELAGAIIPAPCQAMKDA